jgi:phenylalanine ammonia-lyase
LGSSAFLDFFVFLFLFYLNDLSKMDRSSRPHALATYQAHKTLRKFREGLKIQLDGNALDIATVVAVAKYGCTPHLNLNEGVVRGMKESVELLQTYLAKGFFVYGM